MLAPWLGHVDPLVLRRHVRVDGPPALTSREWVRDFNEVEEGRVCLTATGPGTGRAPRRSPTSSTPTRSLPTAASPRGLPARRIPWAVKRAARMFAVMNASMADAIRNIWKLKLEVGFWRPAEAIVRADEDGLDETVADPNWKPYRATPPYSDYASGHAVVTGTFAETARMFLGDHVPLTLGVRAGRGARSHAPGPPLRHALGAGTRRVHGPHLGRHPLPRRHGRRLPHRPHDRPPRGADPGPPLRHRQLRRPADGACRRPLRDRPQFPDDLP